MFCLIVFRLSCYCKSPVALPHGAVGWSAFCGYFLIIITLFSMEKKKESKQISPHFIWETSYNYTELEQQ